MLAARKSFSIQLPFGVDIVKGSVSIKASKYILSNESVSFQFVKTFLLH